MDVYIVYLEDLDNGEIIEFFDSAFLSVKDATLFICYEAGKRGELLEWYSSREARAKDYMYKIRLFNLERLTAN